MVRDIFNRMAEIISEQLGVDRDQVQMNSSVISDFGADSLDRIELIMEFEEEFNISIPDNVADDWDRLGSEVAFMKDYIQKKQFDL